jgi:hypothetical protein
VQEDTDDQCGEFSTIRHVSSSKHSMPTEVGLFIIPASGAHFQTEQFGCPFCPRWQAGIQSECASPDAP